LAARALGGGPILLAAGLVSAAWGAPATEDLPRDPRDEPRPRIGYELPAGETHERDMYLLSPTVRIAGEQKGDLAALARSVSIPGTVQGDVFAFAQLVEITGTAGDSVRAFAETVVVSGTIEGDLLAFAKTVNVLPGARISGSVVAWGQTASIGGEVGKDLKFTGGEISISGRIAGDAKIRCDQIQVASSARIGGNLAYIARNRLDLDQKGIVAGSVDYEPRKDREEEEKKPGFRWGRLAWFLAFFVSSFLFGWALLASAREAASRAVDSLDRAPLLSAGVGLVAVIVTPVAAFLLVILLLTIPLALVLLLLWLVGTYAGKLPVAVWIGRAILARLGRTAPIGPASLFLGLLVLHPLFQIPYLGVPIWFVCAFLGLGAILTGARGWKTPAASAAQAPASGSPAPLERGA